MIKSLFAHWHFHQRHNKKVAHNLARLDVLAATASSQQAILDQLHPWQWSKSIRYQNQFSYALLGLAAVLFLASVVYGASSSVILWGTFISIIMAAYGYFSLEHPRETDDCIHQLSQKVYGLKYDIQFDQVPIIDERLNLNPTYLLMRVRQNLPFLNQGADGNEFGRFAATYWQIENHRFPVLLFEYIALTEQTYRDHKGNKVVHQQREYFYGACIFHLPMPGLVVSRKATTYERYPIKWQTSDIAFNRQFHVYGQNELEIVKILTPHRLIALAQNLEPLGGQLMFHEEMDVMCYLSKQPIFEYQSNIQKIGDISALRGHLRTLHGAHYERMQRNLSAIIKAFYQASV